LRDRLTCVVIARHFLPGVFFKLPNVFFLKLHGVRDEFLRHELVASTGRVYMMCRLNDHHKSFMPVVKWLKKISILHVYGKGRDRDKLNRHAHVKLYGNTCDVINDLNDKSIYISSSSKEGICTATLEAIFMNKHVLIRKSRCNEIFQKYVNVHFFSNKHDFKSKLIQLMQCVPKYQCRDESMSWRSANARLVKFIENMLCNGRKL